MDKLKTINWGGLRFSFISLKELWILYRDIFVLKEYDFKTDSNAPLILDCGSHIGVSVLYFKKRYTKAKIFAFEPNPQTFKILKLNVSQNNLKEVELINAALADKEGKIDYYIKKEYKHPWALGDSAAVNEWYDPKDYKTIKVRTIKLSPYIKGKVDLIKLDVEGMEGRVLKEVESKLGLVKEIMMEFHGSSKNPQNNIEEILAILDNNSFDYTIKQGIRFIKATQIKKKNLYWLTIHAKKKLE